MGQEILILCTLALVLCAHISATPYAEETVFLRSVVETVPPHNPIAAPVRASVESIPLRSYRDDEGERIPLRDAVEKRPISTPDRQSLYKFLEDDTEIVPNIGDIGGLRHYYGAANYLNNANRNSERLQQGNANLQEMQQTNDEPATRRLVVCYMESWAAYRMPPLAFTAGLVPKSCTHLHYAFATLHPHTYAVTPTNEDYDVIKGGYRIVTGLKRRTPGMRVLISVGGDGSDRLFSEMAKEPKRRKAFVDSAIRFLQEHDFDGLDLHWVYAGEKDEMEKEYLTALLYELRERLSSYGFLLSTVLPPFRYQIEDGYDLSAISGAADYAILQAWDMTHGVKQETPSNALQHSVLHRDPGAAARDQKYDNIEFMVKFILRHGMAAEKLVLGVPLFGRSYSLAPSTLPAPGAAVSGWGNEGQYTQTKGLLAYFEICMAEREGTGSSGIDEDGNAYAVFGNQWVSYDSQSTIVEKMKFIISTGLAGAAAWAIDMDDFRGLCGSPFPILSVISTSLNGLPVQTDQSSLKLGPCGSDSPYLESDEVSCAHFHFCTGSTRFKLICEDERLYDPSTGYCGHQDATKCIPGESLRITANEAVRFLSQSYETDFEWSGQTLSDKKLMALERPEQLEQSAARKDTKTLKSSNKTEREFHKEVGKALSHKMSQVKERLGMATLKYGIEYYKHPELSEDIHGVNFAFDDVDDDFFKLPPIQNVHEPNKKQTESPYLEESSRYSTSSKNKEFTTLKYGIEYYKHPASETVTNLDEFTRNENLLPGKGTEYREHYNFLNRNDSTSHTEYYHLNRKYDVKKLPQIETKSIINEKPKSNFGKGPRFGIEYYVHPEVELDAINSESMYNDSQGPNKDNIDNFQPISDIIKPNHDDDNQFQIPIVNIGGHRMQNARDSYSNNQAPSIEVINNAHPLLASYEEPEFSNDFIATFDDAQTIEVVDASENGKDNDKRVVCYVTSWAFYRRGDGKFAPEYIDTRLCTHVVYAYASLSPDELIVKEFDTWTDITNNLFERVTSLKDVTVLLGIGGWTDSAGDKYSRLVSSASARAKFIEKLIPFLRNYNFRGLHFDWNYPVCWQSNCKKGASSDKANFARFAQELSKALHEADMELGIAVSGYKEVIEAAYDLPSLSKSADFLSAMTYDYHGGWEQSTGHHTPLTPAPNAVLAYYTIEYAIKKLIEGGANPKKLNLGLSFYGQSYRLVDNDGVKGPGSPAMGPGTAGEFTKQPGMLAYHEICFRVSKLRWKTGRQNNAGPYAYADSQWVGYEDPKSITEKVEWALRQGLGGVTAWAIDLDDFNNRCCMEPSPLLRAAGRALGRNVPPPPKIPCERPPEPVTPAPPTTTTVAADGSMVGSGGGDHSNHGDHGGHGDHTTTTWPSWTPSTTTVSSQQTWWPQPSTTPSTTTTTTTTTTTRRPTSNAPTQPLIVDSVEGASCEAGEYRSAPSDCESYLQCEGGVWKKHRCAPGLHWYSKAGRCDWPSFAKCSESTNSQASTATSTLAPLTSRPPPPSPTTTKRPTTTTTTTRKPYTTTRTTRKPYTTTTTTKKPSTTTTEASMIGLDGAAQGESCSYQDYSNVVGDCNAYLHCDGSNWRLQKCAPGLHWNPTKKNCDWPQYANCKETSAKPSTSAPTPTRPPRPTANPTTAAPETSLEGASCDDTKTHSAAATCDSYLLCVSGTWKKQKCPPGLHWDDKHKRCDWMDFAMCQTKAQPMKTPTTNAPHTTKRPVQLRPHSTTRRPALPSEPVTHCQTGSYHAHPRCDKFFVCVNGMLVAQSCAPGLVWNADRAQCDFPAASSCNDKRQTDPKPASTSMQLTMCNTGEYAEFPGECTRYRHCLYGRYQEFACSAGLHWNQEKQICDWPKNAKCKKRGNTKPSNLNQLISPTMKPQVTKPKPTKPAFSSPSSTAPTVAEKLDLQNSPYKLVCYFTNWAWYRPGLGQYGPEDIDRSLCTHIVYGFAVLGSDGFITAHDSWADYDNQFYERVVAYKRYGIKVSLALGGWNDSAGDKYSKLVNDPEARAKFVTHAVEFIEQYGFDGLDLDWEYPKCWQVDCSKGPDSDKEGFSALIRELSAIMEPKGLLLSSAVSPNKKVIDEGYDVPVLAKYLDWIAVMTYDYHGQWDKKTGHVAPLYYHPDDDNTYFNANYTIHYWMKKGAPASKLVMGMPMYGQAFTTGTNWETPEEHLQRMNATGLNVPAVAGGEPGEYTRAKGFLAYYEICERIKDKGWTVVEDPYGRMGPYAYKDSQWVSYDDIAILEKKVNFIKSLKLAGGMVWALDLDDFRNRCGQGKHPLLNAIKKGLLNPQVYPDPLISQPLVKPPKRDEDLDDIEVRPGYSKPTTQKPYQSTQKYPIQTTKKPLKPVKPSKPSKEEPFKVVCYYTNWAWYRPESGKFSPSDIDPSLCTHIVYAFAVLDSSQLIMKPHDTWLDVENKFYEKVVMLKKYGVKVLLGLGGWNDSSGDKYSRLVNSPSHRRTFVVHALDFIEQFEFDGLDLDWEYPKCWQVECEKGPRSDKEGFANLIKELRTAFEPRGLLLSAAVSPSKRVIDASYDVPVLSKNLDWIAVMTYDYHGQWEKKTGHVAPMYVSDEDEEKTFNANFTIHYWIEKGAARQKLVMGVPMYGQSFAMVEAAGTGLGVPAYAGGEAGDETRARGFLAFYEICERIRIRGWRVTRDPGGRMGPYATRDDQWVSFDDDFMARHKAEYVRAMGLGGSMVWAMDLDDFTGKYCGCGKSPLLTNINHVLRGKKAPPPCLLQEILSDSEQTTTAVISKPDESHMSNMEPASPASHIDTDTESSNNELSLDGKTCFGIKFTADTNDCSKYYLCNNDRYVELRCPEPLHWNKNHCDWASKSNCRSKAQLRLTSGDDSQSAVQPEDKPTIACYFTNWAYYRHGSGKYGPEQVGASLCTHIIYAWAHLDAESSEIIPGNAELDIENDFYGKITEHRLNGVKVIIGAGGLEDSEGDKWGIMAADKDKRKTFVKSVLKFITRWKFDGLQLAWQYPVCKQVTCKNIKESERQSYSDLIVELSKAMRPQDLELSALVASSSEIASVAYDPEVLAATADWIAVAANDYYASSSGRTSYLVSLETNESSDLKSFNTTLAYWSSVVPTRQIVIGVPSYARSYTLRSPSSSAGPGALTSGPGEPGAFTNVPGFLAYYEICSGFKTNKWIETQTDTGTFALSGSQWASYLRVDAVERVASSVRAAGVRGASLWALDLDDWRGECSCGPQPILRALRRGLLSLEAEKMCLRTE